MDTAGDTLDVAVEFHFLDVGQGECTVILDRSSSTALVLDCPAGQAQKVTDLLQKLGEPTVDAVVITHWDLDHYGGALEVAAKTSSRSLIFNRDTMMSHPVDRTVRRAQLLKLLSEPFRAIRLRSAPEGTNGTLGALEWTTLAPSERELLEAVAQLDRNLASIVFRGSVYGRSLLISGDADGRVWRRLIEESKTVQADILRWPHHGGTFQRASGASIEQLLDAVQPTHVLVSVGTRNRYGHPNQEVIAAISCRARLACTEVTGKCHDKLALPHATPCGGHLSFTVYPDGRLVAAGGWTDHDAVVASWNHPMCVPPSEPA
jgi:competence protein ComEC